ncbi:MAG: hypothetical protein JNL11_12760 [Bdellovibrionaceae bacterium]|nr:hypothetical protein [Pseudobdellovibrionaceae bacterium]
MKTIGFLTFLIMSYFIYGFYISQNDLKIVDQTLTKITDLSFYDYKGVINVHSDLSIGSSPITQIIRSAKNAKLDFMILTDLNEFSKKNLVEGYFDETLILSGSKVSYLDSRFMVVPFQKQVLGSNLGDAQIKLADLLSQEKSKDHLIILSHPFKTGFSWTGPLPQGLDGIELINLKSLSQRAFEISKLSPLWSLFVYPFNSALSFARLFNEPTDELNLFDSSQEYGQFYGFSGAEASARAFPVTDYLIKFPSYQKTFEIFSNHVLLKSELTGNAKSDKFKILTALKNGNFYLAFDMLGDPKGFKCTIEDKSKSYLIGSKVKLSKNLKLKISLPQTPNYFFEVVIYRNGSRFETINDSLAEVAITDPGVYRIQVRVSPYFPLPDATKWITWIYTNPFFVHN